MFTGIVEETGEVLAVEDGEGGRRVRFGTSFDDLAHGQSISVSGVCLTVEEFVPGEWFSVFLASETIERTFFDDLSVGDGVNLERAMPADGRFDGHVVQGHVDGTAAVVDVESIGDDQLFTFSLPPSLSGYLVEKGSITVDGISLTVADLDAETFTVAVIPTTSDVTTLSAKTAGDPVHLEVDVVAKYVERLVQDSNSVRSGR